MSTDYNAVQESIKIALDAADAATDVTAEYNKIRRDHKKLENSMKQSQRFISIIFVSSVAAAISALVFAGLIYFRTLSELSTMTTTSREALIVFAENVDNMNSSLERLEVSLETQTELVSLNETLIGELSSLKQTIANSNSTMAEKLDMTANALTISNSSLAESLTKAIANELNSQNRKMFGQLQKIETLTVDSMSQLSARVASDQNLSKVVGSQQALAKRLDSLAIQNQQILNQMEESDSKITFP
ncbi:hypothetical protein N9P07_05330 [Alphaproteobacteria bacterium]|nr:hypothetical protein [Alphaproteobacteria bacterium]